MVPHAKLTALGLVVSAVCLTVTGELFLKSGMNRIGVLSPSNLFSSAARIAQTSQVWTGFGFIGLGAILWLIALSRGPLSWAYPLLSIGYIIVLFFSRIVLDEPVSPIRWVGTAVIVFGVYLVFRS